MKRALLICLSMVIAVGGCSDLVVTESDRPDMSADIETTWSIVHTVYPFLEMKRIDWDSVHTVYQPLAGRARGDEILPTLLGMLSGLHDGHISLILTSGRQLSTCRVPRSQRDASLFDPLIVRGYTSQELTVSSDKQMEYGVLAGNIGYIRLTTFVRGSWTSEFPVALEFLRNTNGLVVDIRHNGGGSTNVADEIISRFIDVPVAYPFFYSMGQLQPTMFVQPAGPFRYAQNVVVLTNGVCFSSAEYFAEMMKQVPAVTAIGDTPGGGGGIPSEYSLPSGAQVLIPRGEYRRHDGIPIEWNGIPPDIRIANTEAEVRQGKDSQLEYALQVLR
jgi:hypothetical protein